MLTRLLLIAGLAISIAGTGHAQTCDGLPADIVGTDGDDDITGTDADEVIVGLGGDDRISGQGGNDIICGGDGDDDLLGDAGDDRLFGDAGNDVIEGGGGTNDHCDGVTGTDSAAQNCETRANVDVRLVPVVLHAEDGVRLDGLLHVPTGDALEHGYLMRRTAMIVSHGAMGAFFGSVPKTLSLRAGPRGFTVLALNRRDWGPTGGGGAVLFEDATLDVGVGIDLLDAMGFESVYVAGHSQGTQNAGIYPSFTMDPRVAAVGMYGAVDDGRDVARNLLFQTTYDQDVALAQSLVAAGQGDVVIAWPTIFGVDLFRSPNNYLSYWGPDSLSVLEREIANLETPALLMRADGDQFTPDRMSQNVLAAGLAAGIDISYTVLDYPFPPGDNGGNAHGFIAVEREMTAATVDWLTSRVAAASRYTPFIKAPREQPDGNLAPLADAGYRASVSGGEIVLLDGSISVDVDGEIASYYWEQVWGSGAVLDDPASPTPAFVAPNRNQVAVFMLTVTDDDGAVDRDFVRVDVHAHACVWPGPDANWRELLGYWLCRYGIG